MGGIARPAKRCETRSPSGERPRLRSDSSTAPGSSAQSCGRLHVSGVRHRWRCGGIRLILDGQRWRNSFPDVTEDALPTVAVDTRIVESALRRPPLRHMTAAARVEKLALLASFAQLHAGLERLTPARIVLNILESIPEDIRIGFGAAITNNPKHVEGL